MREGLEPRRHARAADLGLGRDVEHRGVHVAELVVAVGVVERERHARAVARHVVATDARPGRVGRVERRRRRVERAEVVAVDAAGLSADSAVRRRLPVIDAAGEIVLREREVDLLRRSRDARAVDRRAHGDRDRVAVAVRVRDVGPRLLRERETAPAARPAAHVGHRVAVGDDAHVGDRVLEVDLVLGRALRRHELDLEDVHVGREEQAVERVDELRRTEDGRRARGRAERRERRAPVAREDLRGVAEARRLIGERAVAGRAVGAAVAAVAVARAARAEDERQDARRREPAEAENVAFHGSSVCINA